MDLIFDNDGSARIATATDYIKQDLVTAFDGVVSLKGLQVYEQGGLKEVSVFLDKMGMEADNENLKEVMDSVQEEFTSYSEGVKKLSLTDEEVNTIVSVYQRWMLEKEETSNA